jgi:protein TonB
VGQFRPEAFTPVPSGRTRGTLHRGGAVVLSLLAHAALAAVAAHQSGSVTHLGPDYAPKRLVEITAPELVAAPKADESTRPARLPPSHDPAPEHREHAPSHLASRNPLLAPAQPTAPQPSVLATTTATPHFIISAGPVSEETPGPPPTAATGTIPASVSVPLGERQVDVAAKLVAGATPPYPASAEAAGIEANVPLELVIDAQGTVRSAVAQAHVGYGLDEAALTAVRSYRFAPARRDGHPVAVRMHYSVRFELR